MPVFSYLLVIFMLAVMCACVVWELLYSRDAIDSDHIARLKYISAFAVWLSVVLLPSTEIRSITWESVGLLLAVAAVSFFALYESDRRNWMQKMVKEVKSLRY